MELDDITDLLKDARKRQDDHYFNGFIHAYCDNQECTAREFSIRLKTYGVDDPKAVRCPLCGEIALADAFTQPVETLDEHTERIDRQARQNVNQQRFARRERAAGRLFAAMTVKEMMDDSLPE